MKFYTFHGNLRNHLTERMMWQHRFDINSIKTLKKYSNEIDLWSCLRLPLFIFPVQRHWHGTVILLKVHKRKKKKRNGQFSFSSRCEFVLLPQRNLGKVKSSLISDNECYFHYRLDSCKFLRCNHAQNGPQISDVIHRAQCTCASLATMGMTYGN